MSLLCALFGHKWDRSLDDIPQGALFARIDCTRKGCDMSIDGAPLLKLREEHPEVWARVESRMP